MLQQKPHILVPLDGSVYARHALPAARSIARRTHANVSVVRVHETHFGYHANENMLGDFYTIDGQMDLEQRRLEMNSLAARCCELVAGDVEAGCTLLDGPIVPALVEHAQSLPADLVVMTTHGRGAFSRAWLGSVVDGFVRHCPVPTLLVRPQPPAEHMPPGDDQPWQVQRILIPLDGSQLAEQVVEPAARLAAAFGAEVVLLRVLAGHGGGRATHADPGTPGYAAEQGYLDAVADRLRAEGLAVRTLVEAAQQPARAILEVSEREQCDLVALATHGRGGLARVVLGSTADKIVRGSELPVLLLRP